MRLHYFDPKTQQFWNTCTSNKTLAKDMMRLQENGAINIKVKYI